VVERFNMTQFDSLVAELRSRYDIIIFDAPPAVVAGEPMMLANKLDAAVLIVRANQEHRGLVARLIGQLADTPCELIGIVLNRPRGTAGGYFKKNYATMAKYASSS
jgi:Mrp family chromosome partitioning ATPase